MLLEIVTFLRKFFSLKGTSGSKINLERVQEPEDNIELIVETEPSSQRVVEPVQDIQVHRRSDRLRSELEKYGFLVLESNEVEVIKNDEPTSYQETMSAPDLEKWLGTMESKVQSIDDNQVLNSIDPYG